MANQASNPAGRNYTTLFLSAASDVMTQQHYGIKIQQTLEGARRSGSHLPIFFNIEANVVAGAAVKRHHSSVRQDFMQILPAETKDIKGDVLLMCVADDSPVRVDQRGFWIQMHQQIPELKRMLAPGRFMAIGVDDESESQPSLSILGVYPVEKIQGIRVTKGEADVVLKPGM